MQVNNIVTDSRQFAEQQTNNETQSVFLALKGPNFDGHRFAQQVIENGCQVLVVEQKLKILIAVKWLKLLLMIHVSHLEKLLLTLNNKCP